MAVSSEERLKNKYGSFGKYNDMIDKILADNKKKVSTKVTTISMDDWNKAFQELTGQTEFGHVKLVLPDISGTIPTKKVINESAQSTGRIMSQTLRDNLKSKVINTLQDFIDKKKTPYMTKRGELKGKMNPELITQFEKKIKDAFQGYTKKDRQLGMPPNIHVIAVTEMRSAVSLAKKTYADKLKVNNPSLNLYKRWKHNGWLVNEPRPGHQKLDGKEIPYDKLFDVDVYKKIGKRYYKTGRIQMKHPHDPMAPIDQVAGCQCDFEVFHKRR